jgi:hypothetical protein
LQCPTEIAFADNPCFSPRIDYLFCEFCSGPSGV